MSGHHVAHDASRTQTHPLARESVVLRVRDLHMHFEQRHTTVRAVNGVSFDLHRGEIVGLVGESGSGKSMTGYSLLGLIEPPGRIVAGSVELGGEELVGLPQVELRRLRGRRLAMVFQDPIATLNPVLTIAQRRLESWPHQFSGGMRQRVAIAMALLHRPAVIVADEPTTALDVSIQAQILSEVQQLVRASGTALLWISHDLATVAAFAQRVMVMYAGRIVEEGPTLEVLRRPRHPYTAGLLGSLPQTARPGQLLAQIPGSPPSLDALPPGCAFAPRCPRAEAACRSQLPLRDTSADRAWLCHRPLSIEHGLLARASQAHSATPGETAT
jgi:peptide/nickel transport system ATP-binding protein